MSPLAEALAKLVEERRQEAAKARAEALTFAARAQALNPLVHDLQTALLGEIEARISNGQLSKMWSMAHAEAAKQFDGHDAEVAALTTLLGDFARRTGQLLQQQALAAAHVRFQMTGRAEALEAIIKDLEHELEVESARPEPDPKDP